VGRNNVSAGSVKPGLDCCASCSLEAGNSAAAGDAHLKKLYHRLLERRDRARAKVAVARHVLVHAYIMMRDEIDYAEFLRRGVAASVCSYRS